MPKKPMVVDEVLLRRARGGDAAAFVEFATRWWPVIGRLAWSMLGNAPQAIVVTEEVLAIVLESPQAPEPPIGCCMYRLAVWLAIPRRCSRQRGTAAASPVLRALDELDSIDRAAFVLRDVEQLTLPEAAAILEFPVAEVQARNHRARLLLIRSLDRELAERLSA